MPGPKGRKHRPPHELRGKTCYCSWPTKTRATLSLGRPIPTIPCCCQLRASLPIGATPKRGVWLPPLNEETSATRCVTNALAAAIAWIINRRGHIDPNPVLPFLDFLRISQQTRVYPYPLGAGSARPNPKMGAPDPENPFFLGFSVLREGVETMV